MLDNNEFIVIIKIIYLKTDGYKYQIYMWKKELL